MNTAAIYHRPESEFAYLYTEETMHIRLRTAKGDIASVQLVQGDPYLLGKEKWYQQSLTMEKLVSTELYDYWFIALSAKFKRLSYAFTLVGTDGLTAFYGEHGIYPLEEKYLAMANNYFRMPYFHEIDRFKAPEWVKETVWYQIFQSVLQMVIPPMILKGRCRGDLKDQIDKIFLVEICKGC